MFLCKEGKSGKIAACNKPFKPVSVSPFEYRCFPDPNDPDAAQESAKQAESAKAAQSAQEPALQPADPTNCLVVQHDSTIVGTDFGGQPIDIGSSYLANNCNCDMNVAMASMEFAVEANQRTVVPTAGSIVYPYVACFAPQSPAYIGDDKYECRGNKPQSECRITGNFVERRKAEPPAESWNSAAAQSAQPDGSQTSAQPDDSCQYANDGECDEPSPCPTGTDATDCAAESGEEVAEAREADSQLGRLLPTRQRRRMRRAEHMSGGHGRHRLRFPSQRRGRCGGGGQAETSGSGGNDPRGRICHRPR